MLRFGGKKTNTRSFPAPAPFSLRSLAIFLPPLPNTSMIWIFTGKLKPPVGTRFSPQLRRCSLPVTTSPSSDFSPFPKMELDFHRWAAGGDGLLEGWKRRKRNVTLASAVLCMGHADSWFLAGMFYSTKCNRRACMAAKAEMFSCPPQPSLGSSRALGKRG